MYPNTSPKILIVDDDRSLRTLLKLALEEDRYQVFEAKDGEQCLNEYNTVHPDLIILDGIMPEMDGFTCCENLRKISGAEHLPILMVTVLDDEDSIDQAFNAGATDYITKPIHWTVLSKRVQALLRASFVFQQSNINQQLLLKHQQWEYLVRKILNKADCLSQIKIFWQLDNVFLYLHLEKLTVAYEPNNSLDSLANKLDLHLRSCNLAVLTHAENNSPLKTLFEKSQISSFFLAPLLKNDNYIGFLCGYSKLSYQWSQLDIHRIEDLSKLIAVKLPTS